MPELLWDGKYDKDGKKTGPVRIALPFQTVETVNESARIASAAILPEQTIGRGLRLMFRDASVDYRERVDIIGNKTFMEFVEDLEKLEEVTLDTFEVGKDRLKIVTILPLEDRKQFDIGLPLLTPALVRKKSGRGNRGLESAELRHDSVAARGHRCRGAGNVPL